MLASSLPGKVLKSAFPTFATEKLEGLSFPKAWKSAVLNGKWMVKSSQVGSNIFYMIPKWLIQDL